MEDIVYSSSLYKIKISQENIEGNKALYIKLTGSLEEPDIDNVVKQMHEDISKYTLWEESVVRTLVDSLIAIKEITILLDLEK